MKKIDLSLRGRAMAVSLLLYFGLGVAPLSAAAIIVTNNNDSGPGSLRQAFLDAKSHDVIVLNQISGQTINLNSPLPVLTVAHAIDNDYEQVIIDGTNAGPTDGLVLKDYVPCTGLYLRNFNGDGVKVTGPGVVINNVTTTGNSGSGLVVEPGANNTTVINLTSSNNGQHGIDVTSVDFFRLTGAGTIENNGGDGINAEGLNYSQIFSTPFLNALAKFGPPPASEAHIKVSGNGGVGIRLVGSTFNVFRGLYIGTNSAGTSAQPNAGGGVFFLNSTDNIFGGAYAGMGNLVSGNPGSGLEIKADSAGSASRNQVIGNFFGTNIGGTAAIGGLPGSGPGDGLVLNRASDNIIGGNRETGPAEFPAGRSNLFSGNKRPIAVITGVIDPSLAKNNLIKGNFVGTNLDGTGPVANTDSVTFFLAGSGNAIGGPNPDDGNVIAASANGSSGIRITSTSGTIIQNNSIGTDVGGTINLGNTGSGILISQGSNTIIGGRNPGEGNVIFFNGDFGVQITGPNATRNLVVGNQIFFNTDGGTSYGGGVNNSQTVPTITSVTTANGVTTTNGTFTGTANTPHFIDLSASPTGQVGSNNQGKFYLGSGMFTTLANGTGTFTIDTAAVPAGSTVVNATKTDANGNSSAFTNSAPVTGTTASADLDIVKTTDGRETTGGEFAYKIFVLHTAGDAAENVSLTDIVPSELTVLSCAIVGGGNGQVIRNGNDCRVDFGTLTETSYREVQIVVKPAGPADYVELPVTNTARVTSTTPDPDPRGNSDDKVTRVGLPKITTPADFQNDESGPPNDLFRISTFLTDAEGWTCTNAPVEYRSDGGNPGGFLFVDNPETTISKLIAPGKFLGNLSAFNGGTLFFEGNMLLQNAPPYEGADNYGQIEIIGKDLGRLATKDIVPGQPPEKSWTTYSIPMTAAAWGTPESHWAAILKDVGSLQISIEARFGEEQQGIDNIRLLPPDNPGGSRKKDGNVEIQAPVSTPGEVMVTLPQGLPETVTVDFETVDGTALAGQDYVPIGGTLIFPPGATTRSFNVVTLPDGEKEVEETFRVRFSNPVNAGLTVPELTVKIVDDDNGFANISTRLRVETGDNVLIGGFIVTGTEPKKVIIRAIGSSLQIPGKLQNPTLELHGPNGLIEANDNWVDSPNKQAIIDSTIPPTNDLESAIIQTLPANNAAYTAIVRGANNGTGIGVVEAYDLDNAASSKLANISTRGFVQTGDDVLIAGTIIVGQLQQKALIRAIGPSLPFGGTLANPALELRDQNGGLLQANDNWIDSPDKQAIINTTIPPANDAESAILVTLPANASSYTAIVRGVNNTTGIAVVEIYALP